ncbi:MAG: hypothetical protein HON04_20400, partial [Planctomicrobium sp.]|nr:hypothetical protein [Planctomicrobium sp.]
RTTIYLYSSKKLSAYPDADVAVARYGIDLANLPRGQIVGTIEILDCCKCEPSDVEAACVSWSLMENRYSWKLENPQRCDPPLPPRFLPYGMWFYPFKRRNKKTRERR